MVPVILVFAEIVPKIIARQISMSFALNTVSLLENFHSLFYPLITSVDSVCRIILFPFKNLKANGEMKLTKRDIKNMIYLGHETGGVEADEAELIHKVLDLESKKVERIMVPLYRVSSIGGEDIVDNLKRLVSLTGFSRIPVYRGNKNNIVGIVNIYDILYSMDQKTENAIVQNFIKLIAEKNITIVSGLAIGIDSLAHAEAVDTKASTIAVLGSPINRIYPQSNLRLAEKIIQKGLLISEFPIGSPLAKENFPKRNRIIAGLSQATLIIEAAKKSGTLITAQYALNENREVLAIPGSIFQNNSQGTNNLIKQGAKIITEIKDILEIYNIAENKKQITPELKNKNHKIIYNLLKNGPLDINKIISLSKIDPPITISCLTQMELSGLIINIGNQNYQLK